MKGLRSIPKILKINNQEDYKISCLFNNGESRIIDFEKFFQEKSLKKNHPARKLMANIQEFKKVEVIGNTIGWANTGVISKDVNGEDRFYNYEIDPIVLYEFSEPDPDRSFRIGEMIRNERKKAGLTQEELARRTGTTKHYISRLENDKSDIELLTLRKIVEAGLDRKLKLKIE